MRKLAKTIALGITLLMLSSCVTGSHLESVELKLTKEQKQFIKDAKTENEKNNKGDRKTPRIRAIPQVPEDTLFTLIYYVGINKKDKRRAVILDLEDDDIEFIPTVRDFEYEILQSVSIPEAIYEAEIFMGHEGMITDYYFKGILDPREKTIGYEIRPIYAEGYYSHPDALEIKYLLKRRRVNVSIDLIPKLKK